MSRCRTRVAALLVLAGVVALTLSNHAPDAIIKPTRADAFDGARAMQFLGTFVGDGAARAVGSAGHTAASARLCTMLADLGAEVVEQPFQARGWNRTSVSMMNLLVRVRGTAADGALPGVLLSAHYDSVAAGEGAGDNAAGVACALEIIRALKAGAPDRDVIVLFSDGEEVGLCGARAFATDHPLWSQVGAVVNLDARGSDGPVYAFETGLDGPAHAALLASLSIPAHTMSLASEAYRRMPNGTDFSVYLRGGRPGFNLAFIGSPRNYHTDNDTVVNLDGRTVNQMGESALALVRALARGVRPMLSAAEIAAWNSKSPPAEVVPEVWFDLFGLTVVHWPAWLSGCALAGSLIAFLIALRALRRSSSASIIGSVVDAASVACSLFFAVAAGTLVSFMLKRSGMVEMPWPQASIWWGEALLLIVGALSVALPSRFIARRRQARRSVACADCDAWLGGWIATAVLCGAIGFVAPGAIHPLLIAIVAAAALTTLAQFCGAQILDWCAVATGAVALLMWAPLEPAFADAFGLSLGGFTALRGALVMIAFRPLCDPVTSA
ncbi:MAG: M20/M25/M40 family metallo-hydrolase [Phycisphaerales bacterium]|nr:M20/M25/M40 family metallo-hydrolase [Phycisphaerales bacterium]